MFSFQKRNRLVITDKHFPVEKATLRNKRKLAALNRENRGEHSRSNLRQDSSVPRSQEDYITQSSEEIEGRVTKNMLQEFSKTENRILGALSRFDDFLMNPLIQEHSGTVAETYPERIWHKPGNEWGRLPEWSSTWSKHIQEPDNAKFWLGTWRRQSLFGNNFQRWDIFCA